ncbi:protein kinase family protein [Parendozoicomonas haliclonae]|uniref:Protein kinase domain protein n=1 Tax=Parendozoicomonas haliclonae TaxID=1960125 RepID=A0A1X7AQ25_9GAMM|nr:protein kinase family protein [Parendozoicomonas haliclonae]SMA50222.1 Protein kinase domain protein [Parendozoicomonas haliclonae]
MKFRDKAFNWAAPLLLCLSLNQAFASVCHQSRVPAQSGEVWINGKSSDAPPTISGFTRKGIIGRGAHGQVLAVGYRGTDYALKLPHRGSHRNHYSELLCHEVEIWKKIHTHPNIISIKAVYYAEDSNDQIAGIVMEKARMSLQDLALKIRAGRQEKLSTSQVKRYLIGLFSAMRLLSSVHILYGDLHYGNILIGQDDELKLADFTSGGPFDPQRHSSYLYTPDVNSAFRQAGKILELADDSWCASSLASALRHIYENSGDMSNDDDRVRLYETLLEFLGRAISDGQCCWW